MENFVKYFKGVSNRDAIGLSAYIVVAQHPKALNLEDLANRYKLNVGTIKMYRKIMNGVKSQDVPKHIDKHLPELLYVCKESAVLWPKDIFALQQIARDKGQYYKGTKSEFEPAPIDFELDYEIDDTPPVEPKPVQQPKDYVEITEREIRSNRLMYFAGLMSGIAAFLLFVLIERA